MSITLTDSAAAHIHNFLETRGTGIGLRLGVKSSGCTGMAYTIEFADEIRSDDVVFDENGVRLLVDAKSLLYLDGTALDYCKEGLNEGFIFSNPNVSDSCGCGKSFTV